MKIINFFNRLNNLSKVIVFSIVVLGFFFILIGNIHELFELPKGIHAWKQSMHFSIVKNYAEGFSNFFQPMMDNLFNQDNTGNLIQEFPILNYIASFFFKDFPFSLKIINTIIFLIGLYFTFRLCNHFISDWILSLLITLNLMFIPVIFYYGISYIVDVSALFIGIMSVYFHQIFKEKRNKLYLFLSFSFFTLAGLIRLPVIIFPLSYFILEFITNFNLKILLYFLGALIVIILWYLYVAKYNHYYISTPKELCYFLIDEKSKLDALNKINDFQKYQIGYTNSSIFYFIIFSIILLLFKSNVNKYLLFITIINFTLSLLYFLLWFLIFKEHDYYILPIIPSFLLLWIFLSNTLINYKFKFVYLIFILITIINLIYSIENIRSRLFVSYPNLKISLMNDFEKGIHWWMSMEDKNKWKHVRDISPYKKNNILSKHGIKLNDTAIVCFDETPTCVLSILGLKGWSNYNGIDFNNFEHIKIKVKNGAKYLIAYGIKPISSDLKFDSILKSNLVLNRDSIYIYNIQHLR